MKLKYYKDAIEDFTKAIKINPKDSDVYYKRDLAKQFLSHIESN